MNGFIPFDEDTARDTIKEFLELPNIFTTVHMYKADGTLVFAERRKSFSASLPIPELKLLVTLGFNTQPIDYWQNARPMKRSKPIP